MQAQKLLCQLLWWTISLHRRHTSELYSTEAHISGAETEDWGSIVKYRQVTAVDQQWALVQYQLSLI